MTDLFSIPDFDPVRSSGAVRPGVASSPASITAEPSPKPSGSEAVRRPGLQPRKAAERDYPAYHDTVPGVDLRQAEDAALRQEGRILKLYQSMGCAMTPSRVHRHVGGTSPLTSTRRAITTLERRGWLVKTDETAQGPFGRPEHAWRLAAAETKRAA